MKILLCVVQRFIQIAYTIESYTRVAQGPLASTKPHGFTQVWQIRFDT